ncbi:MAG: hypothetical protein RDV48_04320 [Candidatus Eremiobacteraeota bacterium]|nr:hypothetical protein [Candidatus Eremiobacteraeota bacterium]
MDELTEHSPQEVLPEDIFYEPLDFFDGSPFHRESFQKEQLYTLDKVKVALAAMEEDIDETTFGIELLTSTFQIEAWKKILSLLEDSLRYIDNEPELIKCLQQCAVTFYKELMDPIRSIKQFTYLLHMKPYEPEHWGAYALCLIDMSDQCFPSPYDLEKRSVLCFMRGARLSLAHLFARDRWYEESGRERALTIAKDYYYNASDAYPNTVARKGLFLTMMLSKDNEMPTGEALAGKEILFDGEDLSREVKEILALPIK